MDRTCKKIKYPYNIVYCNLNYGMPCLTYHDSKRTGFYSNVRLFVLFQVSTLLEFFSIKGKGQNFCIVIF